jgi:carboxymethylenebutenolidase
MIVNTEYADISLLGSPMRTFVAAPTAEGQYPGIWCYSDIFQLTPPMLRTCVRLAGYGFVAAAPEIYRRIEPPGTVIRFDDAGRVRGQQDAAKTPVAHFDADCRAGAATSPSVRRSSPMSVQRSVTTPQASMTVSSVRRQMPDR